jgi:allophanate hydrolase subunit 1
MNRVEPNVLEYSRFNTVYERTEHDADMLKSLDRLVKISNDLINPLSSYNLDSAIPVIFDDNKCEDIASMARLHRDACRPNSTDLPKKAVNKWLIRQGKP